jgi:biopolymer transport protein ExbB
LPSFILDNFLSILHKGGPVMWVLLFMSIVSLTLIFERVWFWINTNHRSELQRLVRVGALLRAGNVKDARLLVEDDHTIYGAVVKMIVDEGYSPEAAIAAVESQRYRFERSMGMLSAMLTAAPLVGLLGTVSGLISTFRLFSDQINSTNPQSVGLGLSEALFNTAGGLAIAIVVLFPLTAFRTQIDRSLSRLESLIADAARGQSLSKPPPPPPAN